MSDAENRKFYKVKDLNFGSRLQTTRIYYPINLSINTQQEPNSDDLQALKLEIKSTK